MSISDPIKLIARNAPAIRKSQSLNAQPRLVAGNPISTRLESGIGNCFPGLECDLRNLERRFFPFLEVDFRDTSPPSIVLIAVDLAGAKAARAAKIIDAAALRAYRELHAGGAWQLDAMSGSFGPLGTLKFTIADLDEHHTSTGQGRLPIDAWTAVRLLTEDTLVQLSWKKTGPAKQVVLSGKRARYLNDNGALADMFAPGELTQSLCSPWTHDFRDCACFYWASNHPDIALPAYPSVPTTDPKWDLAVTWERSERNSATLPPHATHHDPDLTIMQYFEINRRWQKLNFVIEGREQTGPYAERAFTGTPLPDGSLEPYLRYAAGVELAVLHEYLAAVYSLKSGDGLNHILRDDIRASRAEIMRIALGEMRHLRAVNIVLASVMGRPNYRPALGVATKLPGGKSSPPVPVVISAFDRFAQQRFIDIESPSEPAASRTLDGVYARILATLELKGTPEDCQAIRTIMSEGEDHYRTFLSIQEWLARHDEADYLRAVKPKRAPLKNPLNQTLQHEYATLLDALYRGYSAVLPDGAADVNTARNTMISGVDPAADALAQSGFLIVFNAPAGDTRFASIAPPPP
jgi:hypothetical protein